ncbi:exodeoxyribonuclease VII small subunit [Holzapfeliella sp. He02]|uniref:Exodeoxyribonuclease 7 small subunit n=1 Tax=Holzapfeliella saturejae TaxID=3082953 RepID=A0ABU8SHS8_9LACO
MAESPNFESQLQELETIVKNLENAQVPLEEALDQFKKGVELSQSLQKQLVSAEDTVNKLMNEEGQLQDFNTEKD